MKYLQLKTCYEYRAVCGNGIMVKPGGIWQRPEMD